MKKKIFFEIIHFQKKILISFGREQEIIKLRFGFYGEVKTQEEIAKMFGITNERVRQLELKGLYKLRKSNEIETFACYMDNEEVAMETINYIREFEKKDIAKNKSYVNKRGELNSRYKKGN